MGLEEKKSMRRHTVDTVGYTTVLKEELCAQQCAGGTWTEQQVVPTPRDVLPIMHPWDSGSQSIGNILPPLAVNGKTPIITCQDWMPRLVNCGLYEKGRKRTQERTNVGKHDKSQGKTVVCWV